MLCNFAQRKDFCRHAKNKTNNKPTTEDLSSHHTAKNIRVEPEEHKNLQS